MTICQSGTERPTHHRRRIRDRHGAPELQHHIMQDAELRELLDATVAGGFDVEEALLRRPTRGVARIALARQVAMYLAHVACGLTKADVGRLFERDRTTAHHACVVVEYRRDNKAFDHAIDHLERIVRIVVGARRVPCPVWR